MASKRRFPKPFKFTPTNPQKYVGDVSNITMRSTWERKFAIWCDLNESCIRWNSEGHAIKYFHQVDGRMRNYFIDFFVQIKKKDGTIQNVMVEVKPYEQTVPPKMPRRKTNKSEANYHEALITYQQNLDKWKAAKEWAKQNGFEFIIMDEYSLGISDPAKKPKG